MKTFLKLWIVFWTGYIVFFKLSTGLSLLSLAIKATIFLFIFVRVLHYMGKGKKPYRRHNFRVK